MYWDLARTQKILVAKNLLTIPLRWVRSWLRFSIVTHMRSQHNHQVITWWCSAKSVESITLPTEIAGLSWPCICHEPVSLDYVVHVGLHKLSLIAQTCELCCSVCIFFHYMAVSHKDWELQNSQIWLAEININHSLDFPI